MTEDREFPVADCDVTIRSITVAKEACLMALDCPPQVEGAGPGTFVMARSLAPGSPPLGRPLSIVRAEDGVLHVIFNILGKGTMALANLQEGDPVALVGPLGNAFSPVGARPVIVADASHVGTLLALAYSLGEREQPADVYFVKRGVPAEPIMVDAMAQAGARVFDGPDAGLAPFLQRAAPSWVGAGAHEATMATVQDYCARTGTPGEAGVQAVMGCGLGVCQSCIRPKQGGGVFLVCGTPIVPIEMPQFGACAA